MKKIKNIFLRIFKKNFINFHNNKNNGAKNILLNTRIAAQFVFYNKNKKHLQDSARKMFSQNKTNNKHVYTNNISVSIQINIKFHTILFFHLILFISSKGLKEAHIT